MQFALLTALLWAFAGFGSSRIARHFGSAPANGMRLAFSTLLLLLWVSLRAELSLPSGWTLFALAGLLHLTLGDIALFAAYRRLGPRLGVLMVASLSPVVALVGDLILLGGRPGSLQLLCAAGIVASVAFAVAPRERFHLSAMELRRGLLAGGIAALGQGVATSVNRLGFAASAQAGDALSPYLPALLRVGAGALGVWLWIAVHAALGHAPLRRPVELIPHKRVGGNPWMWMAISTVLGPVLGMIVLMEAIRTTPSVLVQAMLAILPVFMLPIAWALDGNPPSKRSAFAGLVAVVLTMLLVGLGPGQS